LYLRILSLAWYEVKKAHQQRDGMHAAKKTLETLGSLGLTNYQAKAYLALLAPGEAIAEEVSELSGVPRSKVYLVLEELRKKEWIEVEQGRPLRFRPKDPRGVIDNRVDALGRDAGELKTELGAIFDSSAARAEPGVEFFSGGASILERELDLITSAQHIIVMTGGLYFPGELEAVVPTLHRMVERGVTLVVVSRALVTVDGKSLDIKEALTYVNAKKRFEETSVVIKKILVDGARGMVLYAEEGDNGVIPATLEAVATRSRAFLENFNPR
jgi:sugar-specific transcriptional regulator TrmB